MLFRSAADAGGDFDNGSDYADGADGSFGISAFENPDDARAGCASFEELKNADGAAGAGGNFDNASDYADGSDGTFRF